MTDANTPAAAMNGEVVDLSGDTLDLADTATMDVEVNGVPSGWLWTFAGPGHPVAIAQSNRVSKERLAEESDQQQAQVNGKKWKAQQRTVDEVRSRNVGFIVERLLGWSKVRISGEMLEFSPEAARTLLLDPRKGQIFDQAIEFLAERKSFIKRSATTS